MKSVGDEGSIIMSERDVILFEKQSLVFGGSYGLWDVVGQGYRTLRPWRSNPRKPIKSKTAKSASEAK